METPVFVQQMQRLRRARQAKQREEALRQLEDLERMSYEMSHCVEDHNGEPGNGWKPDLKEAARLIGVMYWKTVRARLLLEDRATDGAEIEIALCESARGAE